VTRNLLFMTTILLAVAAAAASARAADAGKGERLARGHCAPCHRIALQGRNVVAAAPPFEVIGRKYGFDAATIAVVIAGPHPKMNFAPGPADAADIAAYIATLRQ
jgi:mono/diheme cytochrome c family protein